MKTVLVTGASGGIGAAAALELARRGWNVALHYRSNQAAARQVERDILALGGTAKAYQADLTQEAQVEALFAAAEGDFGFVEGLVNNAGTAWKGLFTDMTLGDWRQVLDADLTSVFLCCRRALPPMIRRKRGSIVNVSSMWGQVGASCEAAYSAAKAGVIGLTKALAQEEGPSGIRVNCLAPGVIDTPMNGDLSPEDVAALREETPLGRTGTPREAGEAIAYLLEAEFLTGKYQGRESLTAGEARELVDGLLTFGPRSVVVTSGVEEETGRHVVWGYNRETGAHFTIPYQFIQVHFPGTGDMFSAVLVGELLAGRGLEPAVRRAMDVLETLIRLERDEAEKNKGIRIEKYLSVLNQ